MMMMSVHDWVSSLLVPFVHCSIHLIVHGLGARLRFMTEEVVFRPGSIDVAYPMAYLSRLHWCIAISQFGFAITSCWRTR